jgi:hypothetical protein
MRKIDGDIRKRLMDYVEELRDDADSEDDAQTASDLRIIASTIDIALAISTGGRSKIPEKQAIGFLHRTIEEHLNEIMDGYDDMDRAEKILDMGNTMALAYCIREVVEFWEEAMRIK